MYMATRPFIKYIYRIRGLQPSISMSSLTAFFHFHCKRFQLLRDIIGNDERLVETGSIEAIFFFNS